MEKLAAEYPRQELILLTYHTQGKYSTDETRDHAMSYSINPNWTPSLVFNGLAGSNLMMGPLGYEAYKERFETLRNQDAPVLIQSKVTSSGFMSAAVELTNLGSEGITFASLYAVVYEDTRQSEGHYLVKDITPVSTINIPAGGTAKFDLNSVIRVSANNHMVIILRAASGIILQALFAS